MKNLLIVIFLCLLLPTYTIGQNYLPNGGFELGLNTFWKHSVENGAEAIFKNRQDSYVMEGSVGLTVLVKKAGSIGKSVKSETSFTVGNDSLYLLRFWARGQERSKMVVEIEGSQTPGVTYELHRGRTLFHLPFKTRAKNLKLTFWFMDQGGSYQLDGAEVLDQNNQQGIDVLNTYSWQHNRAGQGWTAGDNDVSCKLPDGRTVWFFNDSFYGTNDVKNNPLYEVGSFIRNAMVIQNVDGSLITRPFTNQHGQNVTFEVPDPIYNDAGSQVNFFWVGDALMEEGKIKVHLIEVKEVTGGVEDTRRSYLAEFSYPELKFLGLEKRAAFCTGYETFFADKDTLYLYKTESVGTWDRYSHVARTKSGNLNGSNAWEYWNGASWTSDESKSARINNMGADGFMKLGEGNYAHVSMPNLGNQIQVSFAPRPEGPWTRKKTVYTIPNDSAYWFYMPNFHTQLPNGNFSISYSVNAWYKLFFAFESFVDKYWYRPRYIQVDLLGLSPYSSHCDCSGKADGAAYRDECGNCVGGTTGLDPCVTGIAKIYPGCNFTGKAIGLNVGEYTPSELLSKGLPDNDLSSVELEDGYELELFDGELFTCDTLVLPSTTGCLEGNSMNDKASSLVVRRSGGVKKLGVYVLQNKQSKLYLGVENESVENKAKMVQNVYSGTNAQKFKIVDWGNHYQEFINMGSGYALNVPDDSRQMAVETEQWDGLETLLSGNQGEITAQYADSPVSENVMNLTDHSSATQFLTFHNQAWVQFKTPKPVVASSYRITSASDTPFRDPLNASLRGSNDGQTWTLLDTLANIDFPARRLEKSFSLKNTAAYSYYRLNMQSSPGYNLQLAEWSIMARPDALTGFNSMQFTVQDAGNGYFRIINKNSDMVIEVIDGLSQPGSRVRQMPDYGQESSLWKLIVADSISTGISTIDNRATGLKAVPNPVDDELNLQLDVDLKEGEVIITNLMGVKVWGGPYENKPIPVGSLKPGLYFIRFSKDKRTQAGSFIKR